LDAKARLVAWQQDLERRESNVARKTREIAKMERQLKDESIRLKKRVAALDKAEPVAATQAKAALETAAATVIQRAARRTLAKRKEMLLATGLRTLEDLEVCFQTARREFAISHNELFLHEKLTKLLEKADGIQTHGLGDLRKKRKQFVRRVMQICDDPRALDNADLSVSDSDHDSYDDTRSITSSSACDD